MSEYEKKEILSLLNDKSFSDFYSIFTDTITEEEWDKTKDQIKKKFCDELFDVDNLSQS